MKKQTLILLLLILIISTIGFSKYKKGNSNPAGASLLNVSGESYGSSVQENHAGAKLIAAGADHGVVVSVNPCGAKAYFMRLEAPSEKTTNNLWISY